jgi:hypothetical protein
VVVSKEIMAKCGFGHMFWTFIRTLHYIIAFCIHKHSFIAFVFLNGCFGKKKKWSFMFRYVQKRKASAKTRSGLLCFDVYEKKGRCFFAFDSKY